GVLTIDLEGRIQYVNRAMQDLLGYPEDELIGKRCENFVKSNICATEDCILKRSLAKKEKISNYETYVADKEGRRIPVNINTDLLYDDSNNLIGIVEVFRDLSQIKELKERLTDVYQFDNIVTKDRRMKEILAILPSVAHSKSIVLIQGESGTGKELIAKAIHNNSARKDKPFIAVNCAAIPDTLIESELFGHVKGSFTGAHQDRIGRFELANHGTIFLDEIGDMSLSTQAKLLRVIQEEKFERVGGTKTISVDVHIIAATNKNLTKAVKEGSFREDLFYRISVFPITLPPLRERKEDIQLLISYFIEKFNKEMGKSINNISPQAMKVFMNYYFPGNIRELRNIIEHAFVCSHGNTILPEHLPRELVFAEEHIEVTTEGSSLNKVEKEWILKVLEKSGWRYQEAARRLGISRTTLWRKLKAFGLTIEKDHVH
ncbi:MAG TPA: sigma-54-dependent Fis family transcriptional regulator, partial [Nitrospiraceae bacterium]|nr:sigma-54-dependent Fis family transcriptional regulator [Nitrospiraceae bacterium]